MLEFGKLEVIKQTFTRKETAPRGQAFDWLKFRRYESESKANPGTKELFVLSNKAFEILGLETYALTQANFGGNVYLMVVEDQDETEPAAKILRRSKKKDGTPLDKGTMFSNDFVKEALEGAGILDATTHDNQYLALVKQEVSDLPEVVKAVYQIIKDETVDASADTENETVEAATTGRDF